MNLKEIGNRLRECRLVSESTQLQIANNVKITRAQISAHECGRVDFKVEQLRRYCEVYRVSATYLLYGYCIPYKKGTCSATWRNLRTAYYSVPRGTKQECARACGMAGYELSRYFRYGPGYISSLHALCQGLNVTPDAIVFGV